MNVFDKIVGTAHVVAESTKLRSTRSGGGHMANVIMTKDMDNGCLVSLGEYVEDEVYKAAPPIAGAPVYLIITPPLAYNNDRKFYADEKYFYNAKGEIARGYQIFEDDFFTLSIPAFATTRTPVKGDYVSYSDVTQLYTASTTKGSSGFVGQITNVIPRGVAGEDVRYEIKVVAPNAASGAVYDASVTVTMSLTDLDSDAPAFAYVGDTLVITLTGKNSKVAPDALTSITMGGSAVDSGKYTYANGVITLPNVSGAVAITASGANAS